LQGGRERGNYGSLDAIDYEWIAGVQSLQQAIVRESPASLAEDNRADGNGRKQQTR
jgi:hypothetical protein